MSYLCCMFWRQMLHLKSCQSSKCLLCLRAIQVFCFFWLFIVVFDTSFRRQFNPIQHNANASHKWSPVRSLFHPTQNDFLARWLITPFVRISKTYSREPVSQKSEDSTFNSTIIKRSRILFSSSRNSIEPKHCLRQWPLTSYSDVTKRISAVPV